jgi:hypothetical protein
MTTNLALDVSSSRVVLDGGNWAGLNHATTKRSIIIATTRLKRDLQSF